MELVHADISIVGGVAQGTDRHRSSLMNRHGDSSCVGCSTQVQTAALLSLLLKPCAFQPSKKLPTAGAWKLGIRSATDTDRRVVDSGSRSWAKRGAFYTGAKRISITPPRELGRTLRVLAIGFAQLDARSQAYVRYLVGGTVGGVELADVAQLSSFSADLFQ